MDRKAWKHTILQPNSYSFAVSETGIGYNAWAGDCSQNGAWEAIMWYTTYLRLVVRNPFAHVQPFLVLLHAL